MRWVGDGGLRAAAAIAATLGLAGAAHASTFATPAGDPADSLERTAAVAARAGLRCVVTGTPRNDRLAGRQARNVICGLDGNDVIEGGEGDDLLFGGAGDDRIEGGRGPDRIYGGPGRDRLAGGPGNDRIYARDGQPDVIVCGDDRDGVVADRLDRVSRTCESVGREPAASAGPPGAQNVVLVLTDDQRWDTLGEMPIVQRELVARSVTFTNAFAVNPLCCPSRASLLTGQYSHSTGVYRNSTPYGGFESFDDSSTLATWLREAGFETGFFGKYLNGYEGAYVPPGWSRWVAFSGEPGYYHYELNVDGALRPFGGEPADYSTDVLVAEAVSFIRAAQRPVFVLLAPYAPHEPAFPALRHADTFAGLEPWRPPSYDEEDLADKPGWVRKLPRLEEREAARLEDFRRRQLASLLAVDEGVGAVLEALEQTARLEQTVVVYTSDNGLSWGEHRLGGRKLAPYDEIIRVPLVVRYGAEIGTPRTEARLVANIDVAPTLAELAGVSAPGADGRSLVPLLTLPDAAWRDDFLVEHLGRPEVERVPTYCQVRSDRYSYVGYRTGEEELYDLELDPYQLENRAGERALRPVLVALRARLRQLCSPPPPGFTTFPWDVEERPERARPEAAPEAPS